MGTIFMLLFFSLFLFLIFKMSIQISHIVIPQRLGFVGKIFQPLVMITFLLVAWFGSAPFFGYILSMTAAIMLILSLHNKGMTDKGIIPLMPSSRLKGVLSKEFKFDETSDWLIIQKKSKFKVRFQVDKYQSIYYIYFPIDKKAGFYNEVSHLG